MCRSLYAGTYKTQIITFTFIRIILGNRENNSVKFFMYAHVIIDINMLIFYPYFLGILIAIN